jgi:cytochrome c biogenesis protein CcmG/thiol:disulfide interchange protein DsbE
VKRGIAVTFSLLLIAGLIFILGNAFGKDPHEVPFKLAGKPAPNFHIKRLDTDQVVSLSDYAGKPVVLNFWATWCGPCKFEHPVLDAVSKEYGDRVVFLGIVFEDTESNAKSFLRENGWNFPQLFDPKSTVAVDYGVSGVPETYFISRTGIIVKKYPAPFSDPETFSAQLEEILR